MAVAVKNSPEVHAASPFDRLPVVLLVGVVYVLGSLGIVFKLLPSLIWPRLIGANMGPNAAGVILGLLMLVAGTALIVLGSRLLGPSAPLGSRAGIFVGLVGLLFVLLIVRWVSMWIEHWVYTGHLFGAGGPTMGAGLTALVGAALLLLAIRWLFKPSTEKLLVTFENQGWFSAKAYKPLQGQKVRRGTILGLLLIFGAGIYTLVSHGTLRKTSPHWEINIPFTGKVVVENPGDVGEHLEGLDRVEVDVDKKKVSYPVASRYDLRTINEKWADPKQYIKLVDANKAELRGKEDTLIPKAEFDAEVTRLREEWEKKNEKLSDEKREIDLREFENKELPKGVDPEPASGAVTFDTLMLLPGVQFTVPLLLLVASLWLAWRVVNLPTFADFLIATEAEMNKVSWTTKKRLYQDTLVVLTVVILMAGFLFSMDQAWRVILSWKPIGVLQFPEDPEKSKSVDEKPW